MESHETTVRRVLGGSRVFRAASAIDIARSDIAYADAVVLARLVLEHDGGPVPTRGKRALTDMRSARRLTELGLTELEEGFGREVGTQNRPGWKLRANDSGKRLVTSSVESPNGADDIDAEEPIGATLDHVAPRHEQPSLLADEEDPARRTPLQEWTTVWLARGVDARHAEEWLELGTAPFYLSAEEAASLAAGGFDAHEVALLLCWGTRLLGDDTRALVQWGRSWLESGANSLDVLDFARAGVAPEYAKILCEWHNKGHLRAELEAREDVLANFQDDVERKINELFQVLRGRHGTDAPKRFFLQPLTRRTFARSKNGQKVTLREDGVCPGTGIENQCHFRDGMEEWYVICPICGMTWMGGSGTISEHPDHLLKRI